VETLEYAADRIRRFAVRQRECIRELRWEESPGIVLGHRLIPVDSCGCYVPAGRYPLPSTALMSAIPARVAGVRRVAACSPASAEWGGIHPVVLVAMDIAGVDEVYCMGGAQAIGGLVFGTETVKAVDFIVGPGNSYVTEAKRQVAGRVGIDMLAGPSEVVIIADDSASPEWVAADVLARCEHGPGSWAVVVTTSRELAERLPAEIRDQARGLPTGEGALKTWTDNGRILLADSMDEAIGLAEDAAPEHLQVMTSDSGAVAARLTNYGSIFIGPWAPVAFGDYVTGPNHILPTMRSARYSSGVYTGTFLRTRSYQEITCEGARALSGPCEAFANMEGLFGHGRSAALRGRGRRI
jgi:histidinol dehydrogenase/sulfopropanediol 3-dehydrogenase